MKKALISLSALFIAGTSMAVTPGRLAANKGLSPQQGPKQVTNEKISLSKRADMVESFSLTNLRKSPLKISTDSEPIFEAPAGETVRYARTGYGFYVYWFYIMFGEQELSASYITYGDDGYAYIYNPFCGWATDSYLKCEVKDDKLVAQLPQAIYQEADYEDPSIITDYYAVMLKQVTDEEGNVGYEVIEGEENQTVSWTVKDGKITLDLEYDATPDEDGYLSYPEVMFGMASEEGVWTVAGDCAQTYEQDSYEITTVPEGVELNDWVLIANGEGQMIKAAFDGDTVYLTDLGEDFGEAAIVGEIADGKATFKSGQFIGIYYDAYFSFFLTGVAEGDNLTLTEEISFDYDADKKVMSSKPEDYIIFNARPDQIYYISLFQNPLIKGYNANPNPVPGNPIPTSYADYFQDYGYSSFAFVLPNLNAENDLLNVDNMYYQIYIDDELWEFDVDEESGETITDIPYYFSNNVLYGSGLSHTMYLYFTGYDTIGVRLFNVVDGETYASDIITYNVIDNTYTNDINEISSDKVAIGKEFYNLQGVKVANPQKGIYVCRKSFNDGSSKVYKVVIK